MYRYFAIYILERLVLQTMYVLKKDNLQSLGPKIRFYNQERVIMTRIRYFPNERADQNKRV